MRFQFVAPIALLFAITGFAQNPVTSDSPLHVKYAANLNIGDSILNVSNTGASGGNLCANVYTFSPDEQLISCCTCNVTPNALLRFSAIRDLISNPLTPCGMRVTILRVPACFVFR